MNILFTCVGRRVELIEAFRNAARQISVDLKIYGTDTSLTAPAIFFCDKGFQVCRIDSPNYISSLKTICEENKIDALIPTIDTDLLILAQNKYSFGDTKIIISSPEMISICRDKMLTADFFVKCGLDTPIPIDNYLNYNGGYPAFIKPKNGSSSINAFKVENFEELETYAKSIPDYIVSPFVEGKEYTVDILCDFDGAPIYITPRIRLAVRSGEVLKTQIYQDPKIISEMKQLISVFKPCGQITVQMIRDSNTGIDYYIEINPRFGGGAPLSIKAGADSAKAILQLLAGEKLSYMENAAEHGAIFSRFDQSIRVN